MSTISRLLVPLSGSELDEAVLHEAATIAGPIDAEVVLVSVAHYHTRDSRPVAVERARRILDAADERLREAGLRVQTLVGHGEVADEIVRAAVAQQADLVVMGARGHGSLRRLIERSVPDDVRRRSRVPVLLVHGTRRMVLVTAA